MPDPQLRSDYIPATSQNVGAIAAASSGYVVPTELGDAFIHQTLLAYAALPVVTGNTTGISFGSKQVYTWPQGRISVQGNLAYFSRITFNAAAGGTGDIAEGGSGDYGMGSTPASDGSISVADVDMLPSTAMLDPFVAGVGRSNVGSALAAAAQFDGTTTPVSMYLSAIIDDADVSDAAASDNVYFTGWNRCTWLFLGDY